MRTITTILAAALALAPAAAGAATTEMAWRVPGPGTYTKTVTLAGGRDFALAAWAGTFVQGTVEVDGREGVLAKIDIPEEDDVETGASFRAPYSGDYELVLRATATGDGGETNVELRPDCRADRLTLCTLRVGGDEPGRAWNYGGDDDWYGTALQGRRRYEAWLAETRGLSCGVLRLRDAGGGLLPSTPIDHPDGRLSIRFTAPTTGAYFIEADSDCDVGDGYGISLVAR